MYKKKIKNRYLKLKIKRKVNHSNISKIKTLIKKTKFYINRNEKENAIHSFINMQSFIDKQSRKKLIHKNKSSRIKSRLMNKINIL